MWEELILKYITILIHTAMHIGFIYKIVADGTDKVYYGSTTMSLNNRMSKHRTKLDCSSKELFNYGNTRIELLETHHDIDKDILKHILTEVERGYIERFRKYRPGRCVNDRLPNRTTDEKKQHNKKYHIDNAEKLSGQRKEYYSKNADIIKERVKQYQTDNSDEIRKRKKRYRNDNRDEINERARLRYSKMKELKS